MARHTVLARVGAVEQVPRPPELIAGRRCAPDLRSRTGSVGIELHRPGSCQFAVGFRHPLPSLPIVQRCDAARVHELGPRAAIGRGLVALNPPALPDGGRDLRARPGLACRAHRYAAANSSPTRRSRATAAGIVDRSAATAGLSQDARRAATRGPEPRPPSVSNRRPVAVQVQADACESTNSMTMPPVTAAHRAGPAGSG
jgi:hypothetical protein